MRYQPRCSCHFSIIRVWCWRVEREYCAQPTDRGSAHPSTRHPHATPRHSLRDGGVCRAIAWRRRVPTGSVQLSNFYFLLSIFTLPCYNLRSLCKHRHPTRVPRRAFTLAQRCGRLIAFTLMEILMVIVIIAIVLAFLIPAISPSSGRALEGDSRNFMAQLENARLMAISKRTKTRVLIATTNDWGTDFSWRAYVLTSFDSITGNWLQQGKFFRLSHSTAFDSALPTTGIIPARKSDTTQVVKAPNATPTPTPSPFTGAYIEFSPTGSTSLDPSATPEVIRIQDGFVPTTGSSPHTGAEEPDAAHRHHDRSDEWRYENCNDRAKTLCSNICLLASRGRCRDRYRQFCRSFDIWTPFRSQMIRTGERATSSHARSSCKTNSNESDHLVR